MDNINQLILDCAAKVLRINQTTPAQINFSITGYIGAIECSGFKHGWDNAQRIKTDVGEGRRENYRPLDYISSGWIKLSSNDAADNLKRLLESLNALEKELIEGKQNA